MRLRGELAGLFRRRDLPAVDAYLAGLAENGVTMLRLMLEYAQVRHRYFERPVGTVPPAMVQLWDDLFALCEKHGLRLLLTPFDTFWTWLHWRHHPYNRVNGGPLAHPSQILLCRETREAIKARLAFAVQRWGGSGALFAWDLWNEIHPDVVKIDRYLVHGLSRNAGRLAIVRSLCQVAEALGTDLVGEGVENLADLRVLRDLGIRYAQGFLLGRPAPDPAARRVALAGQRGPCLRPS